MRESACASAQRLRLHAYARARASASTRLCICMPASLQVFAGVNPCMRVVATTRMPVCRCVAVHVVYVICARARAHACVSAHMRVWCVGGMCGGAGRQTGRGVCVSACLCLCLCMTTPVLLRTCKSVCLCGCVCARACWFVWVDACVRMCGRVCFCALVCFCACAGSLDYLCFTAHACVAHYYRLPVCSSSTACDQQMRQTKPTSTAMYCLCRTAGLRSVAAEARRSGFAWHCCQAPCQQAAAAAVEHLALLPVQARPAAVLRCQKCCRSFTKTY